MQIKSRLSELYHQKDKWWFIIWIFVLFSMWIWNLFFLNSPAQKQLESGFLNTFFSASLVVALVLLISWLVTNALIFCRQRKLNTVYWMLTFGLNLIRSVPQIVGVLFVYIWITYLLATEAISSTFSVLLILSSGISLFVFPELVDLMLERISYFRKLDFYNAMQVCGIPEKRIINFNIFFKNSRVHILNKLIAVFGIAVFLQCSIDFIVSVGLSTEVSALNLPISLGSLLAKIDSKQDILAIGYSITHPGYIPQLFLKHLQGISSAFLIVFSLLSIFKISNAFAERHRL